MPYWEINVSSLQSLTAPKMWHDLVRHTVIFFTPMTTVEWVTYKKSKNELWSSNLARMKNLQMTCSHRKKKCEVDSRKSTIRCYWAGTGSPRARQFHRCCGHLQKLLLQSPRHLGFFLGNLVSQQKSKTPSPISVPPHSLPTKNLILAFAKSMSPPTEESFYLFVCLAICFLVCLSLCSWRPRMEFDMGAIFMTQATTMTSPRWSRLLGRTNSKLQPQGK